MNILQKLNRQKLKEMNKNHRKEVLQEVSNQLTRYFAERQDFDNQVNLVIKELESLGHYLRLFDMDFDVEDDESSYLWCGDWESTETDKATPLIITFHSKKGVEIEWSKWSE